MKVYSVKASRLENGGACVACQLGIAALTVSPFLRVDALWTVDAQGRIDVTLDCQRDARFPWLPRFGLRLFLPQDFASVEYFGYGPYESYLDKHQRLPPGHLRPGGGRHARGLLKAPGELLSLRAAGTSPSPTGPTALTAASETAFSMNVSPYTQEELAEKNHNYELEKSGETVFCLDYKMSGVGSNSCGPELLPQYRLEEEEPSTFRLHPSAPSKHSPSSSSGAAPPGGSLFSPPPAYLHPGHPAAKRRGLGPSCSFFSPCAAFKTRGRCPISRKLLERTLGVQQKLSLGSLF